MTLYKQNQIASPLVFFMTSSVDHVSPVTGIVPVVTLSKNGEAFAAAVGDAEEIANGWYRVVPDADDFDTIGPLILHATGAGADATDVLFEVNSGLVDLGPSQLTDIVGNVQGSVGSVIAPVTCRNKCKTCC